ncbi:hypothetical protein SAMN05421504_111221 [Amycolatopsis xylanica]|uniref:Uncharacterized protein n=1 Tax=Amycolatopsis xylanica TaxID=589385 RepID=A0A1H3RNB9_9PSEU|nr:hypothetical protein [Amycolatopsis xylanica]SDZ27244.1 hypothetical protein SAMN05421504_111221 [Amycolatopsis xylanica]
MRRTAVAITTLALLAATAGTASAAYPKSDFGGDTASRDGGTVDGTFTWYERSVGVSGAVFDREPAGSTTVTFKFYSGSRLLDIQTRTATNEARKFGWTEPGPAGGISAVEVYLSYKGSNEFVAKFPRKV